MKGCYLNNFDEDHIVMVAWFGINNSVAAKIRGCFSVIIISVYTR